MTPISSVFTEQRDAEDAAKPIAWRQSDATEIRIASVGHIVYVHGTLSTKVVPAFDFG